LLIGWRKKGKEEGVRRKKGGMIQRCGWKWRNARTKRWSRGREGTTKSMKSLLMSDDARREARELSPTTKIE